MKIDLLGMDSNANRVEWDTLYKWGASLELPVASICELNTQSLILLAEKSAY